MHQAKCVAFLRWAMRRMGFDWPGFQHCHRQVCKRLNQRVAELGLADFAAYRDYLLDHDTEWSVVDACCRVTVSRFYRDKDVFDRLTSEILPRLAQEASGRRVRSLRAWSAGCGAGEEPFSLALAWRFAVAPRFPGLDLAVVATDIDEGQLSRARSGCYRPSSLRELPPAWEKAAFVNSGPLRCLRPEYRTGVDFQRQDLRADAPKGPFDLILCRNLAFTYFNTAQRREILAMLLRELAPGGFLVIGRREVLPARSKGVEPCAGALRIFARAAAPKRTKRTGRPARQSAAA